MRHRRVIFYTVLSALEEGPLRMTHIMYSVNTSAVRMKDYLLELQTRGLIERRQLGRDVYYSLTPEGKRLCESYRALQAYEQ